MVSDSQSELVLTDVFTVEENSFSWLLGSNHKPNAVFEWVLVHSFIRLSLGWFSDVPPPHVHSGNAPSLVGVLDIAGPPLNHSVLVNGWAVQAEIVAVAQVGRLSSVDH